MPFSIVIDRGILGHLAVYVIISSMYLYAGLILQDDVKAKEAIAQATILSKYFYDAGLAVGAYSLTKNQIFAERYSKLAAQIPDALEELHQLVDRQSSAASTFDAIKSITEKGLNELSVDKQVIDNGQGGSLMDDQGQARKAYKQIKSIADALQQQLDQLSAEEQKLAKKAFRLRFVLVVLSSLFLLAYAVYNCIVQTKRKLAL